VQKWTAVSQQAQYTIVNELSTVFIFHVFRKNNQQNVNKRIKRYKYFDQKSMKRIKTKIMQQDTIIDDSGRKLLRFNQNNRSIYNIFQQSHCLHVASTIAVEDMCETRAPVRTRVKCPISAVPKLFFQRCPFSDQI